MVIPASIVAFAPIEAPFFIVVFLSSKFLFLDLGNKSLVKVTFGPMKTSSSIVIPSQICTPGFMVTLSQFSHHFL
jgi:hypothetical protein